MTTGTPDFASRSATIQPSAAPSTIRRSEYSSPSRSAETMSLALSTRTARGSSPRTTGTRASRSRRESAYSRRSPVSQALRLAAKSRASSSASRRRSIAPPRAPPERSAPLAPSTATIATRGRSTMLIGSTGSPPRWITAARPAMSEPPGSGSTAARVIPSIRVTATGVVSGSRPSTTSKAAVMRSSSSELSVVAGTALISTTPSWLAESKRPGVTHLPAASTTRAPAGTATPVPTAAILPSRITTVPFSIGGPETVYTLPPVMATVSAAAGAATAATAARAQHVRSARGARERIVRVTSPPPRSAARARSPCPAAAPGRCGRRRGRRR